MFIKKATKKMSRFFKIWAFILVPIVLISCKGPDGKFKLPGGDARKTPADPAKRVEQNLKEGRGFRLSGEDGFFSNRGGGVYEFATSNELWRASLDTIDFMSISNVDYAGGLIITDWYSEGNPQEAVKITITFLTNEVRSDALKIDIRKRDCNQNNQCVIKKIESDLDNQIKDKILKKAAIYKKDLDEILKKRRPKKVYPDPANQ